ncbi:MAG: hypothetical protein PHH08_02255, partial [Candidatus ainarchaeum sp.]|nr:hypothetical protein [Candidatus ainarchaeum sp.]
PASTGGYCGDGKCELGESPATCPQDCMQICGDGICSGSETIDNCPEDCAKICGDGICSTNENCSTCFEDCGKCYKAPSTTGTVIQQAVQDATPTGKQITDTLKQFNLEQLLSTALEIRQDFDIRRTIVVTKLPDGSFQTIIMITIENKTNINLTGLVLLETIPESITKNALEINTNNETMVLQENPLLLEFVATGKLEKQTIFYYTLDKQIPDLNAFTTKPIILNYLAKTSSTCATGCNDKNPCTKDQCINQTCVSFREQEEKICGYAQKCHKGICISYPTQTYKQPLQIFGQEPATITLIAVIIIIAAAMGTYYYKKTKNQEN